MKRIVWTFITARSVVEAREEELVGLLPIVTPTR